MYTEQDTHLVHEYAGLGQPFVFPTPTTPLSQPASLLHYNARLGEKLGLKENELTDKKGIDLLTGNLAWPDYPAIASVYCGHQFGVFVPQLGDGRALMIAELRSGSRYHQLQLKGAGETPFSRMADGRAVLRSSIREYVASWAMHALGIPTTQALSLTGTADPVFRETTETAAVVCRVSESFLRFGHMEYFSSTGQHEQLTELMDWHIDQQHPELHSIQDEVERRFAWFKIVIERTARLVAQWQSVGFCHGVMNTDNMSLLGQTIDYGPYGFIDAFNVDHICNHSDHQGRYSYRNQPRIAHWNLYALAQAIMPVLGQSKETLQSCLDAFPEQFAKHHDALFGQKMGLAENVDLPTRQSLIENTLAFLHNHEIDFTRFFRSLKSLMPNLSLDENMARWQQDTFFALPLGRENTLNDAKEWLKQWLDTTKTCQYHENELQPESWTQFIESVNPALVPRNHLLQEVIEAAQKLDTEPLNHLLQALSDPYHVYQEHPHLYEQPPEWAKHIELSCSS